MREDWGGSIEGHVLGSREIGTTGAGVLPGAEGRVRVPWAAVGPSCVCEAELMAVGDTDRGQRGLHLQTQDKGKAGHML